MDRPPERLYVAVDVSNLWRASRKEYGDDARVDFQVLSEMVRARRYPERVQQVLVAYTVRHVNRNNAEFYSTLKACGYRVKDRYMSYEKVLKGESRPLHTDWDVGITIDAIDQLDNYDTFVLMSGDGDFAMLLDYLKQHGKKTIVLTFPKSTNRQLKDYADEMIPLNESIIHRRHQ